MTDDSRLVTITITLFDLNEILFGLKQAAIANTEYGEKLIDFLQEKYDDRNNS